MAVLFIRGRQKVGLVIKMLFRCGRNKDSERRGLRQMKTRVLNFGRAEPPLSSCNKFTLFMCKVSIDTLQFFFS